MCEGVLMNAWVMLGLAGLLEIVWAVGLKYADGFTKPIPSAITIGAMVVSMWLLAQAARTLPIGTAYAVWTGIGAVGAALLGMMLFSESANAVRLGCIALIVAGIIGLKVSSPG
jgi:quaternary ammonium compound-resistance protein SugE